MTSTDIKISRREAQARISVIEAEKLFLQRQLSMPLDSVVDKIKERLRQADIRIALERKYVDGLNPEKDK